MDMQREIICLTGFMGCGKSSVGKVLASRLGCAFADLDDYIVRREGRSIPEIFKEGESSFRKIELEALISFIEEADAPCVLALGGGTFTIEAARSLALERTRTVHLRTELATIRKRLGESDASRPLFADADALYEKRSALYALAEYSVDTDALSPEEVARKIIDILSS